jgi:hypothetical protein
VTEKEREELKALVTLWSNTVYYSDSADHSIGYEQGQQAAAWDLEDWLSNH